ncbi:hypothetical protein OG889_40475 [Streptomyces sp. NBC_00481]|uniref:hypothetical protein n=1 Tax=Streptomyces sp. NBC_00481 TaxID=2975755 RepID=UPI002DDBC5A7|nr:hypothetical protein [Streptomyces sp. NBC_00481]WRZ00412.1 hypothetical protein OG889_40475 [Streptomyces sp. NBC_00481]
MPTIKKCLLTGAAFSLALTGLTLGAAPTAIASTDVNGVHDGLLPNMCQNGSNRSGQSVWYYNVSTKQLLDRSGGRVGYPPVWRYIGGDKGGNRYAMNANWREIKGHCFYPSSASWTYEGRQTAYSDEVTNCSQAGNVSQRVDQSYSTTTTTTKTVNGTVGVSPNITKMFGIDLGAEFSYSWSYGKTVGWNRATTIDVPPGRTAWLTAAPIKRVVRVNPHFWIDEYNWYDGTKKNGHNKWGISGTERDIVDYDYYYDGTSDELRNGQPVLKFYKHDRANRSGECRR